MPATLENLLRASTSDAAPWRWLDEPAGSLSRDRGHAEDEGILQAIGPLTGTNRIAAAFYEGSSWPRFKFWEQVFLWFQGPGVAAARQQVLRHLPGLPKARVLEVGIGEGDNLPLLPASWEVFGADIARSRLRACRDRFPATTGRLAWAEAESLPFEDESFDAVYTVGGINYFRDPAAVLQEMRRVAKPGAMLVAADEVPDLYRFGIGHLLGLDTIDAWWLQLTGLDQEFIAMVLETPPRVEPVAREVWPRHQRVPIWSRLGYCLVDIR
jgi:SAM-dependent methyltransferase